MVLDKYLWWPTSIMILLSLVPSSQNKKSDRNAMGSHAAMRRECSADCSENAAHCLACTFPDDCPISSSVSVNCSAGHCGQQKLSLVRDTKCLFCWQLANAELDCEIQKNCSTNDIALQRTTCRVRRPDVICAGRRTFYKKLRCRWTSGYSWRKALTLSITLGGFGVDRFYLGHWKSGIGKLFSFGGLGVWTLLDIVLIGIGYIQPADESEYLI